MYIFIVKKIKVRALRSQEKNPRIKKIKRERRKREAKNIVHDIRLDKTKYDQKDAISICNP